MVIVGRYLKILEIILITLLYTCNVLASEKFPAGPSKTSETIFVSHFIEMARKSSCSNVINRLFIIDKQLVLWSRVGNCKDAGYAQVLFGNSPDSRLCENMDSKSGQRTGCRDKKYSIMFHTIIENLEKTNLGLDSTHSVDPIRF